MPEATASHCSRYLLVKTLLLKIAKVIVDVL